MQRMIQMLVVLCRGDLWESELDVYGPFATDEEAREFFTTIDIYCPNTHEIKRMKAVSLED
jgi:hypothetical protein